MRACCRGRYYRWRRTIRRWRGMLLYFQDWSLYVKTSYSIGLKVARSIDHPRSEIAAMSFRTCSKTSLRLISIVRLSTTTTTRCTIYLRSSAIWLLDWSYLGRNVCVTGALIARLTVLTTRRTHEIAWTLSQRCKCEEDMVLLGDVTKLVAVSVSIGSTLTHMRRCFHHQRRYQRLQSFIR